MNMRRTPKAASQTGTQAARKRSVSSSSRGLKESLVGGSRRDKAAAPAESKFLDEADLIRIETTYPDGLTLAQVIDAFIGHSVHLSEASFRKYVQLGLLGRSRRVGRKGKHQGSMGVYPASTVRRINVIKQMMAAHYTIEDIQRSFLRFTDEIEVLQRSITQLLDGFEQELSAGKFTTERKRAIGREITALRKLTSDLVAQVESLERQLVSPLERAARERAFGTGAKSGVDELL